MIARRTFIALAAVVTLSACANISLVDEQVSAQWQVNDVLVDVSKIPADIGRGISVSQTQLQQDIKAAVTSELQAASSGSVPVNVAVDVSAISIVGPGGAVIKGPSGMTATVSISNAQTGQAVVEPLIVGSVAENAVPLGGLIGAAVKAGITPEKDYRATLAGFAAEVRRRLFGEEN